MTITTDMISQLNMMHENKNIFAGTSLKKHISNINRIISEKDIKTALDYGCGKAKHHPDLLVNPVKFDAGYPPYSEKPKGQYDLVICTDVMEHVEENFVSQVLVEIFYYATKHVYLHISTKKAVKTLPDGRNAHVTIKHENWWRNRVYAANTKFLGVSLSFD